MNNKTTKPKKKPQTGLKKINSQNYIVIGTAHLGMDLSVLNTIKTVADFYNAKVIHTGPLATKDEIAMWRRRKDLLVTWENWSEETLEHAKEKYQKQKEEVKERKKKVSKELRQAEKQGTPTQQERLQKRLENIKTKSHEIHEKMTTLRDEHRSITQEKFTELEELRRIQWGRITAMQDVFGKDNVEFVCNDSLHIPETPIIDGAILTLQEALGDKYIDYIRPIGSHLNVTAIPANGDKMSGQPITNKIYDMLSKMGGSHIVSHMTPNVRPYPRSGLNQAYNYLTTGCIQVCKKPERVTDAYLAAAEPACVFVSLDCENDEFHTQRLRIDHFRNSRTHRKDPHILHDGLVFNNSGDIFELESEARTVFSTDMHTPHEHMGVVGSIRALNVLHKPATYIDMGDTADNEASCPHTKNKLLQRESLRVINDIKSMYRLLDVVANKEAFPWIKKRVLIDSNHGEWLPNMIDGAPSLKGLIDWPTIAKNLPNWEVLIRTAGEDKSYYLGDLCCRHGDNEGTIAKAKRVWGNYVGGHHHGYYELGRAVFLGPGLKTGPKYLNNNVTSWQNQIASATTYKGVTCVHAKTVLHSEDGEKSRFCYQGEVWETSFYKHTKGIDEYAHTS